jgi:FAD-dependent urate hydroxylase
MRKALFAFLIFAHCLCFAISLEDQVKDDLRNIGIINPHFSSAEDESHLFDVAIIGGGQVGMTLSLALQKEKITNFAIFDKAPKDSEGIWSTTARMMTIRSIKESVLMPALDLPHLDFRAWFEANGHSWEDVDKVPTHYWAEYLHWYRKVLNLDVYNEWKLLSIEPKGEEFLLHFSGDRKVHARKVVLATGRMGSGGYVIPEFMKNVPKKFYFHTAEEIDPQLLLGKKIGVIGCGASAFDIAAVALESGASRVDMMIRKNKVPHDYVEDLCDNWECCFSLTDQEKADYFQKVIDNGTPPPDESVERVVHYPNFHLIPLTQISEILPLDETLVLKTNHGDIEEDLIILGTGYDVNLSKVEPIASFYDKILLWGDRPGSFSYKIAKFPYLGRHFEFLEKNPGDAPYLRNLYCFNYGAYLTHGCISGDLFEIPIGVARLVEGILSDLKKSE